MNTRVLGQWNSSILNLTKGQRARTVKDVADYMCSEYVFLDSWHTGMVYDFRPGVNVSTVYTTWSELTFEEI